MRHSGDRRSHVLPPSRKVRRQSLAQVLKNEPPPSADDAPFDIFFDLPAQGRRVVLETLKNRSAL